MLSEPCGDDRTSVLVELPLQDLGKASAYVFRKRAVDGYTGHAAGWMAETIEMWLGFAVPGRKLSNRPSCRC